MNCKKANKKISQLIDGLLNEKDRLALLEHIDVCDDCKKLYEKMKALVEKLGSLPEMPLPEGAENRLHFALKNGAERPKKRNWVKFAAIAMPATAAVFAAVLGISYLFSGGLTESKEEMTAMEMAPENGEGAMQKNVIEESVAGTFDVEQPEMDDRAAEVMESEEEKSLSVPMPDMLAVQSVNVVYSGASPEEMTAFVEELIADLQDEGAQEAVFDEETQSIKIALPAERYPEFLEMVGGSEQLALEENQARMIGEDGGSLLFEVNFLFQKNN